MPCVYAKVAVLLGKASLQALLCNLKLKQALRLQKDKRSSERFGALLLSPWPKLQYASASVTSFLSAVPPILVVKAV
eukprot:1805034-Pleurochrysis_carterae.AAC.1